MREREGGRERDGNFVNEKKTHLSLSYTHTHTRALARNYTKGKALSRHGGVARRVPAPPRRRAARRLRERSVQPARALKQKLPNRAANRRDEVAAAAAAVSLVSSSLTNDALRRLARLGGQGGPASQGPLPWARAQELDSFFKHRFHARVAPRSLPQLAPALGRSAREEARRRRRRRRPEEKRDEPRAEAVSLVILI